MAEYISYTFNKGIKSFGENQVKIILESFYTKFKIPIVSIGSGSGSIEHYTKSNINWILIDPNPISFHGSVIMEPNFSYIDDLITDNPNIVGNCLLFLNWCDPNDSEYDYEAIIKLQPIAICSIYDIYDDSYGAAGGEKFYNWTINENNNYQCIEEHYLHCHEDDEDFDIEVNIRIKIWQIKRLPFNEDDIVVTYSQSKIRHTNSSCSIS